MNTERFTKLRMGLTAEMELNAEMGLNGAQCWMGGAHC